MNMMTALNVLEVISALAVCLGALFMCQVTFARRTIHFWINILSSIWLLAVAGELFLRALNQRAPASPQEYLARAAVALGMISVATLLVPFNARIQRSKGYDELRRATDELEKADQLFDSFMTALPWPAFIKDSGGHFI
ncbi:MAG TPA: hypothetical protein V6D22_11875 [Candidatus Obscuribacterales bacterium]